MLKKISIVIFLCILIIFCTRNYIARFYIVRYLKKEFNAAVSLKKANLLLDGIAIEGLSASGRDFNLKLKEGRFSFNFPKGFILSGVSLKEAYFQVEDLKSFSSFIKSKTTKYTSKDLKKEVKRKSRSLRLDFEDIEIKIQQGHDFSCNFFLDFKGTTVAGYIEAVDNVRISDGDIRFREMDMKLSLEKSTKELFLLKVPLLKIKDKEINNLFFTFLINKDELIFEGPHTLFLGIPAKVGGILNFKEYSNLCLEVNMRATSFENLVNSFVKKEDIAFKGFFDGNLKFCLKDFKPNNFDGSFLNSKGGTINIEKETSLNFLRQYLDKKSYDVLIDNFKHYTYNEGKLDLETKGKTIVVSMDFNSQKLGKRVVTINLHDILGGGN